MSTPLTNSKEEEETKAEFIAVALLPLILLIRQQGRYYSFQNKHFFFRVFSKSCGKLFSVFLSYFALKGDNCFCQCSCYTANEIVPLQIKIAPLCEGFKLFFSDPCVWGRALSSRFIAKLLWFIKGPAVFHLFRDQNHHIKLKSRQKKESSSPQINNQNRESRTQTLFFTVTSEPRRNLQFV